MLLHEMLALACLVLAEALAWPMAVESRECEVSVDELSVSPREILYSNADYEVSYGLPLASLSDAARSPPIGFFIDVNCSSAARHLTTTNTTSTAKSSKLRLVHALELHRIPVEVSISDCCAGHSLISNLSLLSAPLSDRHYIKFACELTRVRNMSLNVQLRLSMNRRLGDGCSTQLTFYAAQDEALCRLTPSSSSSVNGGVDDVLLKAERWVLRLRRQAANGWRWLRSTLPCTLGYAIAGVSLVVLTLVMALGLCRRADCRRSRSSDHLTIIHGDSACGSIQLKNAKRKNSPPPPPPPPPPMPQTTTPTKSPSPPAPASTTSADSPKGQSPKTDQPQQPAKQSTASASSASLSKTKKKSSLPSLSKQQQHQQQQRQQRKQTDPTSGLNEFQLVRNQLINGVGDTPPSDATPATNLIFQT